MAPSIRILASLLALIAATPAQADVSTFQCEGAILDFGHSGARMLEHFEDGHGHDVELWCVRGVFQAHFDLRFGWHDPANGTRRQMSIAGCFFNDGRNDGPNFSRDPAGAYTAVEWTNQSPPAKNVAYRFHYDVATARITVTVETPCRPPIARVIPPQPDNDSLEDLLPDPPSAACPAR
jgi:hypothetical protein